MKTEDFSHKATITKSGNGEAFADIARNAYEMPAKGSALANGQKPAGEYGIANAEKRHSPAGQSGSASVDAPITEKSGNSCDRQPGGGGWSPTQGGEKGSNKTGSGVVGESGGNSQVESGKAGTAGDVQQGGHSQGHKAIETEDEQSNLKAAGSEARGAKGTELNPAKGEGSHSEKVGKQADASVGHLPSLSLVM